MQKWMCKVFIIGFCERFFVNLVLFGCSFTLQSLYPPVFPSSSRNSQSIHNQVLWVWANVKIKFQWEEKLQCKHRRTISDQPQNHQTSLFCFLPAFQHKYIYSRGPMHPEHFFITSYFKHSGIFIRSNTKLEVIYQVE